MILDDIRWYWMILDDIRWYMIILDDIISDQWSSYSSYAGRRAAASRSRWVLWRPVCFFRESLTSFGYLWMTSCSPGEPLPDLPVTSFSSVMAEVSTGAPFPVLWCRFHAYWYFMLRTLYHLVVEIPSCQGLPSKATPHAVACHSRP